MRGYVQFNKYTHTHSLPSRFAPGTKLMVAVSPRAPWFAGAFSRDCTFLGCRGGVLTINRQPVGPLVSTAAITTATVINHVDSGSFSSRCCTLRRTHTSADPIRILCIRLALTLTLSRPPGFASCARLMVCVSPCALWVVGDFSCDCMFWDDWGGGLTGQPMGPQVCVCVFFPSILDIKFVGRTSRGHTGGRSHRIFNPPSFCGACLDFCREKDSAIPFPRRP